MNDPLDALPAWARELVRSARVARLGLLDEGGGPRVLPVTYVLHESSIWTAVDAKPKRDPGAEPARVRFLQRRPQVAIIVDHYSDDWDQLAWVQILGRATLLAPGEHPGAMEALAARYDQYRLEPPPGPLIRIAPRRALSWRAAADPPIDRRDGSPDRP